MHDADRFKLLGQYSIPVFNYGDVVFCERLGEVEIVGVTDASIPWPVGKRTKSQKPSISLFAGLVEAVRREYNVGDGNDPLARLLRWRDFS